ncbi:MAG: hypothetical protein H0U65_15925 [Rubrobacter sp.]|nr:hypothetical protein [Rubrobacter sp.]
MTRTFTKPVDDPHMWRRIAAKAHPDAGGDGELFVWLTSVKEVVCEGQPRKHTETPTREEPRRKDAGHRNADDDPDRIPYPAHTDFREATLSALRYADNHPDGYGRLLRLLEDCLPMRSKQREQERGASYKRLAAIGHMAGMDTAQRSRWYSVARSIPLSDRHAGHLLYRLKKSEAA